MDFSSSRPRINAIRDMAPRKVSRAYARTVGNAPGLFDDSVRTIARHAPTAHAVLDVGTGPGRLLSRLVRAYPDARVTGLDVGDEMLAIAKEHLEAKGLADRVTLQQGSAFAMPFADETFDLVVATRFIHMIDDPKAFFREAHRVLAPGGNFVVIDYRRDMVWPLYALMWVSTFMIRAAGQPLDAMGPVADGSYTRAEMESALAAAGFESPHIETGPIRLEFCAQA